ncbi:hypothetical protein [Burkholderia sp. 8Y]|uniref:hypothetical protein n=1 Tax=Burkholderia sp. 8Y TaxID=2653133 RepID=UPI001356878B|nr:hypothetical protein [Burkholderia sp. 8Y]
MLWLIDAMSIRSDIHVVRLLPFERRIYLADVRPLAVRHDLMLRAEVRQVLRGGEPQIERVFIISSAPCMSASGCSALTNAGTPWRPSSIRQELTS